MIQFYLNVKLLAKKLPKPDVIIGSSAHPLNALLAIMLGKKYNVESIVEIRDLWPESLVEYNIIKRNSILAKFLYLSERWIYTKANKLIFTMEGGKDYIIKHKWNVENGGKISLEKIFYINNGVDFDVFKYNKQIHTNR